MFCNFCGIDKKNLKFVFLIEIPLKQLLHKIARYFLPVLFISYIGCISLFTHSHVVNGVTIVHSHPYKPGTEHEHTTAEFQLIHMLSSIETENPSMWAFVSVILFSYCSRLFFPSRHFCLISEKWGAHGLRAPPVSVL